MSSTSASGNVALSSVLLGLSTIAVGGRFFARKQQKVVVGVDDIFALAAWVSRQAHYCVLINESC